MLQRVLHAGVILISFLLLTALGGKGGFERAPRVEKNFAVTVTDVSGTIIQGDKFSWDGRLHFSGYIGMAQVTMPFEKIKELTVGEVKERNVKVTAVLRDGTKTTFDIDAKIHCYGEASFGSFMLVMTEIKSIVFK
ncbi:MAG: hypothetical protein WC539_00425 [Nitrospirota bacterium]